MKSATYWQSKSRLAGIGVLAFAVLAVFSLFVISEGGDHPLALETDVALCDLLGDDLWHQLEYPAGGAVVRPASGAERDVAVCALELDPVPPGNRWARIARGEDADRVRRIATVTLTTTALLRQQNPQADSKAYTQTFDQELVASGWSAREVEGPWSWASVYTRDEEAAATLAEDRGVVLWVEATGVAPENLVAFTRTASQRIRPGD